MKRIFSFLLLALVLSGCASAPGPACPETGFVAGADTAALFADGQAGRKPGDVKVYALLRGLGSACKEGEKTRDVDVTFDIVAQKTALGQGITEQQFSYFVAVIGADESVLQREKFYVTIDFGKNDSGSETLEHRVKIPAAQAPTARIVAGFTLDTDQVEFNKAYPYELGKSSSLP